MPKRKVRHALIQYVVDERQEMAFRGQIVDLSYDEAKKLDGLGATVPVDVELDRPGTLAQLPEAPSDEELIAWVVAATPAEVDALVATRPVLAARVEGAKEHVTDLRAHQDKALEAAAKSASGARTRLGNRHGESDMLKATAEAGDGDGTEGTEGGTPPPSTTTLPGGVQTGPQDAAATPGAPGAATGDGGDGNESETPPPPAVPGTGPTAPTGTVIADPTEGTPDTTADVEATAATTDGKVQETWPSPTDDEGSRFADAIVAGTVDDVTDYLSDNPEQANAILEAENRLAAAKGKDPRSGVVRAVEAAAGHTQ